MYKEDMLWVTQIEAIWYLLGPGFNHELIVFSIYLIYKQTDI